MRKCIKIVGVLVIFSFMMLLSCNPKLGGVVIQQPQLSNQQGSPSESERIADGLESLSKSVYKVTVIAFYEVYTFAEDSHLKRNELNSVRLRKTSIDHEIIHRTVLGTVIPVYYDGTTAGFLTCAHVVAFPDSAFTYYKTGSQVNKQSSLRSLAVKMKQQNFISDLQGGEVSVVATDHDHDISFLKMDIKSRDTHPILLPFLPGSTLTMNWGTRLYVLGYPMGKKMVTSALYSKPSSPRSGLFLLDAVFNKGFSGAPVVEYSGQPPYFRWVGMASSIASEDFTYLSPDMSKQTHFSSSEPYTGNITVNTAKVINYGVSYSVSIEQIKRFIQENRGLLARAGIGPIDW
ncbi:MAG: trypsin-like peptidase domain-containing protein [Bacteroidales bacterium]|nr:trypsin-like peptidase domain-containing protein [Bacteroidales bacterium]